MLFPQPGKMVIFSRLTNMQDFQTKKLKLAQAVRNDKAVVIDTDVGDKTTMTAQLKIVKYGECQYVTGWRVHKEKQIRIKGRNKSGLKGETNKDKKKRNKDGNENQVRKKRTIEEG